MYNGEVRLQFNEKNHRFQVWDSEVENAPFTPPSVTTVLGVVNKPALVQWAANCTADFLKERLSTGIFDIEEIAQLCDQARFAHNQKKKEAGGIGTQAHNWLETYWRQRLKGVCGEMDLPEEETVRNCVIAALDWIAKHDIEPILIEELMFSRELRVAGIMDKLARVDGKKVIVDWKSSNSIYPEMRFQTAAYAHFHKEMTGEEIEGRWLVQLGKEDGVCNPHFFDSGKQQGDFNGFLGALMIYTRLQEMKQED